MGRVVCGGGLLAFVSRGRVRRWSLRGMLLGGWSRSRMVGLPFLVPWVVFDSVVVVLVKPWKLNMVLWYLCFVL